MATEMIMKTNWELKLDPRDATLVLKALGGRLRDDEERAEAKRLGDRLTQIRAQQSQMIANEMKKHADKVTRPVAHTAIDVALDDEWEVHEGV